MLFLLPRLGVARWAAFLAALLATLSVAAIYHAQDARECSIDALLATLMIAGLLWYLRDGRKALLCVSLFLAPLLQYGLVLFGAAVMGAATVLPPPPSTLAAPEWNSYLSRIRHWLRQRIAPLLPAACFLAGCALSYATTVRYQWREGGWTGYDYYYYQGAYDAADVLGFAASRTWDLLTYHLPQAVAVLAVGALALMLLASLKRRRFDAIAILALLAVGIAIFAGLLVLYPLGGTRPNLYLGPVIFLAAGVSIHWMIDSLSALTRRAWLAPALAGAVAGAIALAGVSAMQQDSPYEKGHSTKAVLAFLEENVEEGDLVYANMFAAPSMKFYQDEKPNNYHYGEAQCWGTFEKCTQEMFGLVVSRPNVPNRIFLVHGRQSILGELELLGEHVSVERVIAGRDLSISLIANVKESLEAAARSDYEALVAGEPAVRADFDIYINDNTLVYAKEPCARAATEAAFLLHLIPTNVNDLPDYRKQYGFDNLDFDFEAHGRRFEGKCLAIVPLPAYGISGIRTGQYVRVDGGFNNLWETEFHR